MRGFWLALTLTVFTASFAQAQAVKVGYIDSNSVLSQYEKAQTARTEMEASLANYQSEIEAMNQDFQTAMNEYQQQAGTLTPEVRANREEALQAQQRVLQQRVSELEQQAQQRQAEVFQPVMAEIGDVIEQIRVEGNYAFILDTASQAILSADPALNLTDMLLQRLRQTGAEPDGSR
ncbi:MAG: OmpH family outer membrane protein [Longimicrobiales bacterium]